MQQLKLSTDSVKVSAVVHPPAPTLSILSRIAGVALMASPVLLGIALFLYYSASAGLAFRPALQATLELLVLALLGYQFLIGLATVTQIALSLRSTQRTALSRLTNHFTPVDSPKIQPVSIIVWVQNQADGIAETIKSLLALNYPDYEIIIINDGSTDVTCEVLELEFGLEPLNRVFRRSLSTGPISTIFSSSKYPILTVVEKPRTGRADSLNIGLNLAKAPLVCILDPGHLLARDGLVMLAKPFIEEPAITLMSTGIGETQADGNGPSRFSESLKMIERKRLFHSSLIERNLFCLVSGTENAVRMLRKADLIESGGFQQTVANDDLQINLRLQRTKLKHSRRHRVSFIPDLFCWNRSQADLLTFARQQGAWQGAVLQAVPGNIAMLFHSRFALAYLLLIFEILRPLLKLLGLVLVPLAYLLGAISSELALLYFFAAIVFALLESLGGLIADELSLRRRHSLAEITTLILASLIESLVYRPFTAFWRVRGALASLL